MVEISEWLNVIYTSEFGAEIIVGIHVAPTLQGK